MRNFKEWHPNFPVDLENCKDEPIRIPGAIQPFGILIAYEPESRKIRAISENLIGLHEKITSIESIRDLKVDDVVTFEEGNSLVIQSETVSKRTLVKTDIKLNGEKKKLYGAHYSSGHLKVIEIELNAPQIEENVRAHYLSDLPKMMDDIRVHETLRDLSQFTASRIKELTGFDRVMIYKYDSEWNGEVFAESKEERLETFFGLHYPASDIPVQARLLYERNWVRIIPTIYYKPALILPALEQKIDLSDSVIRSVSPIHLQYLHNMDVTASMSISLIVDGKLWGLVACHHYSGEILVPLHLRVGCEAYGQLISWQIKSLAAAEKLREVQIGEDRLHSILAKFSELDFKQASELAKDDLLKLLDCNGVVIRLGEDVVVLGEDPGKSFCAGVAKELLSHNILEPLLTNEAKSILDPEILDNDSRFAGFMALALAPKHNYYIICTRPEQKTLVNWAGNPHEKEKRDFSNPDDRLLPRGSFALWQELHEGKSEQWSDINEDILKRFALLFVKIVIERKEVVEKSNEELKALNRAKDEFVAMVSHELRTPLNAIIGWTELALSKELQPERYPEALKIIQRNARSQNQLVSDLLDVSRIISGKMRVSVRNMRVSEVVDAVVLSFAPAMDAKGVKAIAHTDDDADSIIGDPNRIQQVVWNILSNAIKFSPKNSRIFITVRRNNSSIELSIRDEGMGIEKENLTKIFGRFEQVDSSISRKTGGLGLGLSIAKHIVELHGGRLEVFSDGLEKGTTFKVSFPISPIMPETDSDKLPIDDSLQSSSTGEKVTGTILKGQTVLIVEDEIDASKFLQLLIAGQGAKTYTAHNGKEALEILEQHKDKISIILSDVGMPVMDGYEFMQTVRKSEDPKIKSISSVALTAFGRPHDRIAALRAGFDAYIAKPVMQEELMAVLEGACRTKNRY